MTALVICSLRSNKSLFCNPGLIILAFFAVTLSVSLPLCSPDLFILTSFAALLGVDSLLCSPDLFILTSFAALLGVDSLFCSPGLIILASFAVALGVSSSGCCSLGRISCPDVTTTCGVLKVCFDSYSINCPSCSLSLSVSSILFFTVVIVLTIEPE
ncbi:hypothetical protein TYRP_018747 [Tyrophagus putrescentiae]|nr:hypothetical protein TYRP_018747 [Tyrophagus putrescentiae]